MKFFGVEEFFSWILISKMGVKMNFRIIAKNHAADSKISFSRKIDFRADGTHESHLKAWELVLIQFWYPIYPIPVPIPGLLTPATIEIRSPVFWYKKLSSAVTW